MRLDQYISLTLDCSRKDAKEIIKTKEITINNIVIFDSAYKVNEKEDIVKYNNQILIYEEFIYLLLNKPKGYVTSTSDPKYNTVMSLINEYKNRCLFPVGRLDIDTEGLLLITNDGELSHNLLSPIKHVHKTYIAKVEKELSENDILKVKEGIVLDNKLTNNIIINRIDSLTYEVIISDGKYHEVKRIFEYLNNKVINLKRIKFGNLELPRDLELGKYIKLGKEIIDNIK